MDEAKATLTLDIAAAYPPEANIAAWQRTVTLKRGKAVNITDSYKLSASAQKITLSLLSPCEISLDEVGVATFKTSTFGQGHTSGAARVLFDADTFTAHTEIIPITDTRMSAVWGDHLNRMVFTAKQPPQSGTWVWKIV
jgi:hypothetical protein